MMFMSSMCPRSVVPVVAILTVAMSAGTSSAHDVWLTFTGSASERQAVVNYGHPGDRPPALADKVVDLDMISATGKTSLVAGLSFAFVRSAPVAVSRSFADDGKLLIAMSYDNGYWAKGGDGLYRNASRQIVPGATEAMWSRKFAKAVTGPGAAWQTVASHELEIVPLSDPAVVKPGETLRARVLFRGQPLPNAKVEWTNGRSATEVTADGDGVATVTIPGAGGHTLVVAHSATPSATPDLANGDLYGATFSFSLPRSSLSDWLDLIWR
jgi:uncharacterized GH25 family protein